MSEKRKFYGKYRGIIINNLDPLQQGRIQAIVPNVEDMIPTSWAIPCFPITGNGHSIFKVPPIGTGIWIEFEEGNPDKPIWVGVQWNSSAQKVPELALFR